MDIKNSEGGKGGNAKFWVAFGFVAIVLALSFWWFAWRPMQIKKQCYKNEGWSAEYYECLMNKGVDFIVQ